MNLKKLLFLLLVLISRSLQFNKSLINNRINNNYDINVCTAFHNISCVQFVQFTNASESNLILASLHKSTCGLVLLLDGRNTRVLDQFNCNFYLIFIDSAYAVTELFTLKIFKQFSNILLILKNVSNCEIISLFNDRLRHDLFNQPLNIKRIDYEDLVQSNFKLVSDLFEHHNGDVGIFNEDEYIDRILRNDMDEVSIRVSIFESRPYVIYSRESNQIKDQIDGSEFRILKEITRNWKVEYTYRDFTKNIVDPWSVSLNDLDQNISDVTLGSVWLTDEHYRLYDTSEFLDFQCVTFLVPKPLALTQASIIYLPYQPSVWAIFYIVMVITLVFIKSMSWFNTKIYENVSGDRKFDSAAMILLEMTNIMTSHGLATFPKCPIFKILFISWILLNFLIDVGYVTGYTSFLTVPRYSKSIDTLKDFFEQGLQWGEYNETSYKDEILRTEHPNINNLINYFVAEESVEHRYKLLATHKYSRIVKIIQNTFVIGTTQFGPYITDVQPMKTCLFEYYTTFAFPKSSPFKKIFDRQILRIREAGLSKAWFCDMIFRYTDDNMTRVFDRHIESTTQTVSLTVAHLIGAFCLWCVGLCIAVFAFIGELLVIKIKPK